MENNRNFFKKRILIIMDMINGFCTEGALASPQFMQTIVPNISRLIQQELEKESRIIYFCDTHSEDDEEFKIFPPHCIAGTNECEVIDELKIDNMEIIQKNRYSGFFSTSLDEIMKSYPPDGTEIIICGNCTDICIHYTAEEFCNRNYSVTIPSSCVDTYDLSEEVCREFNLPISKAHNAKEINDFFLKKHFPNILGINVI